MRTDLFWVTKLRILTKIIIIWPGYDQAVLGLETNDVISASESFEKELSEVPRWSKNGVWSTWSGWSECSRTCESGIRKRLRRCLDKRCEGESIDYELCSAQPCPLGGLDFRALQCSKYNKERYKDRLYDIWLPVENRQEPCVLMCKAKNFGFTVKFSSKVFDGTKCNNRGPDVCVEGKCVEVGCDHVLGSTKRLDDCGVCGGDGTTCGRPVFVWRDTEQFSECTKTCGANSWRVSVSACFNEKTGRMVAETLCADKPRPRPIIKECPHEICPEEWKVGMWQQCNVTCGGGMQQRDVFCVEHYNNTRGVPEMRPVGNEHCWRVKKPDEIRTCNVHQCPMWEKGEWSTCSVTCGKGSQYRKVACRQERYTELSAYACDPKERPTDQRPCYAGVSCEEAEKNRLLDYERYRYVAAAPYTQWDDAGAGADRMRGSLPRPQWSKDPWKECSTTCGPGVQTRQVKCVAIQPFTIMTLPSFECEDKSRPKPPEFQPCEIRQCPRSSLEPSRGNQPSSAFNDGVLGTSGGKGNEEQPVARWEYGEWDKCSATCMGGYQSRTFKCVNVQSGKEVEWAECSGKQRPVQLTRQCATDPCPPQWQVGPWSVCSHTCGGGLRTRDVRCIQIHKVGNVTNTLYLPPGHCTTGGEEPPRSDQPCAMENCPPYWSTGPWDECSRSCGDGRRYRMVVCEQLIVGGEIKRFNPPAPCNHLQNKPPTVEICNYGACATLMDTDARLLSVPHSPLGHTASSELRQEYRFKVGGEAKVYEGSRLKIKCPVKDFDRAKITWVKDGKPLKQKGSVKISERGALRVSNFTYQDAGVYTCYAAGDVRGNITLKLKPLDDRTASENKGTKAPSKGKIQGSNAAKPAVLAAGREQGYVVEPPPPSSNVDAPVLLPSSAMDAGDNLAQQLAKLKEAEQKDTVAVSGVVNGSFPRTSSLSLLEELKRYLLAYNKLDVYQALNRVRSMKDVKFSWVEGDWSPCSRTCRDGIEPGMQTRSVRCKVSVDGYETYVTDEVCVRAGMTMPHEANLCGVDPCPQWIASNWTECSKGRCVRHHSAIIRRQLHCTFPNGSLVNFSHCAGGNRPAAKSECWNPNCVAVWRAANWSTCTKTCGNDGIRMRTVQCVWNGTRKAAGNRCSGSSRLKTVSYCPSKNTPCPPPSFNPSKPFSYENGTSNIRPCMDFSKYCPVAKMMGYCRTLEYRNRCCLSCSVLSDYKRHYDERSIDFDPPDDHH